MAGIQMTHVPFKGASEAVLDLMAGRIQVVIDSAPSSLQFVKAGKLKALAVTSAQRSVMLPDLPTLSEAGVPGYEATSWYGAFAAAGTPLDVYKKIEADFLSVIRMPDVQKQMLAQGAEPVGSSADEFGKFVKDEMTKWAEAVKSSGAQVQGK
jgi:tripartite-type tricarboxylate transporter receptor subunit TctC